MLAHEWWTVIDKEGKTKERYIFLFKSRLLICKVRRISEDRSVFVLKDIIKLPEVECRDQQQSCNFDIHFKLPSSASAASQIRLIAHHEDIKTFWLSEIGQYANDQLALHEHTVDDLRIDPTQVKSDTETDGFRLPHRIDAYVSDGVKPSDIAKDYYLPHIEKKIAKVDESVAATVVGEQQQQQQHIAQRAEVKTYSVQTEQISQETQQQLSKSEVNTSSSVKSEQIVQVSQQQQQTVHKSDTSTASVKSQQIVQEIGHSVTSSQKSSDAEKTHSHAKVATEKKQQQDNNQRTTSTIVSEQHNTIVQKVEDQHKKVEVKTEEKNQTNRLTRNNAVEQQDSTAFATKEVTVVDKKSQHQEVNKQVKSEKGIDTHCVQFNLPEIVVPIASLEHAAKPIATPNNQIALLPAYSKSQANTNKPIDADTNHNNQTSSSASGSGAGGSSGGGGGGGDRNSDRQLHPFRTVSYFNFGDRQGGDGNDGQLPKSNLPDFLVPPHLITYQTTFEISIRKIPFPEPPTPPKYLKKLVAQTDSLEKRTRDFLSTRFTSSSTSDALKTARQKMRSLKSMIMLSDDEVRHAEDTIVKAKSGDFQRIYNPYLGAEKPQYEFVELQSEGECSEVSDRQHSDRDISEQRGQTTMDEQYSGSRYSSRSSRKERRTEGNHFCLFIFVIQ